MPRIPVAPASRSIVMPAPIRRTDLARAEIPVRAERGDAATYLPLGGSGPHCRRSGDTIGPISLRTQGTSSWRSKSVGSTPELKMT